MDRQTVKDRQTESEMSKRQREVGREKEGGRRKRVDCRRGGPRERKSLVVRGLASSHTARLPPQP